MYINMNTDFSQVLQHQTHKMTPIRDHTISHTFHYQQQSMNKNDTHINMIPIIIYIINNLPDILRKKSQNPN